jgi:sulfur carrier protein
MITLVINGKYQKLNNAVSVAEYLRSLEVDSQHVAVARNGEVVERAHYADITLADGDRLEIVRPVGGG